MNTNHLLPPQPSRRVTFSLMEKGCKSCPLP